MLYVRKNQCYINQHFTIKQLMNKKSQNPHIFTTMKSKFYLFFYLTLSHIQMSLLLPQSFQLYLIVKPTFIEIFHICVTMFSKLSAAELLYVRKG